MAKLSLQQQILHLSLKSQIRVKSHLLITLEKNKSITTWVDGQWHIQFKIVEVCAEIEELVRQDKQLTDLSNKR